MGEGTDCWEEGARRRRQQLCRNTKTEGQEHRSARRRAVLEGARLGTEGIRPDESTDRRAVVERDYLGEGDDCVGRRELGGDGNRAVRVAAAAASRPPRVSDCLPLPPIIARGRRTWRRCRCRRACYRLRCPLDEMSTLVAQEPTAPWSAAA